MPRYADIDLLLKTKSICADVKMAATGCSYSIPMEVIPCCEIEKFPTADVEKVVRCKNCKHCEIIDHHEFWCRGRGSTAVLTTPEDYCSKGEEMDA